MTNRLMVCAGLAAGVLAFTAEASACPSDRPMGGVVQKVTGQRGEVMIQRAGEQDFRPSPMEALCAGDVVVATAQGASVTLRLSGASASTRLQGPGRFELPRAERRTTVVDNAMQLLLETWMPDIRRSSNFGVVRGRSGAEPYWALPGLDDGVATIRRGDRPLYLRWTGDAARYRVEVARADGAVVEKAFTSGSEVRLRSRRWANGPYTVRLYPGQSKTPLLTGRFRAGDPPPANPTPFSASAGEEIRAASEALRIARIDPQRWSLEALQIIDSAPQQGLDREALYRTISGLDESN